MFLILGKQTNFAPNSSPHPIPLSQPTALFITFCLISPSLVIFSRVVISRLSPLMFNNGLLFIRPAWKLTSPFEGDFKRRHLLKGHKTLGVRFLECVMNILIVKNIAGQQQNDLML